MTEANLVKARGAKPRVLASTATDSRHAGPKIAGLPSQGIMVIKGEAAMRKSPFILALLLVACGGDGNGPPSGGGGLPPVQHAPEISNLSLSPSMAVHMQGGGEVLVSVQVNFADAGRDLQALWVELQDGSRIEFVEGTSSTSGLLTEQLSLSTGTTGAFTVDVWLVDKAGNHSSVSSEKFHVVSDVQTGSWTKRLGDLPFALNDVVWTGERFVAVGDDGKILTSSDGIDWVERQSGTDAGLGAVAFHGSEVVAVGDGATVLLSLDGGVSWTTKHVADRVGLSGVAINSTQIIAGGMDHLTGDVFIIRSVDRGTTWTSVDSWPRADHFVTDLVYANGLFIAGTYAYDNDWTSDALVMVSTDGASWNAVVVKEEVQEITRVWYHGDQFIAAGPYGTLAVSPDGYNWSELDTPVDRVDYLSAAWNGSQLVVAGGISWWYWWMGTPNFERPVGLSSADGGATWEVFNIDGYYTSSGMAWGNGRFVSVGHSTPVSGVGAIYTSE